jgi:lipopolysaccharide/colanic/teichoic acid biosynthesis glycosyltransferase
VSVKVSLLPATCSALGPSVEVDDVQDMTVLAINPSVLSRSSRIAKRALDLVTNWSLWGDVRLILRTVPAVLRRDGAN